ncbi:TPA: hypothetical protein RTH15_001675 [Campylobacter jejuni]|nr:hypothetical protein [Campylobacter jejuni]
MAKRKLNSKRRFSIFKKILLEENNQYWHNVALLEKLWEKIPQCNTNTLDADEIFNIIKKEKIKIDIRSICKFFKITLNKTNGKKFVIFNKNNNLIINYRNESDIFYFLGHIFHNFLDGAYFKYPFKKRTWDLEYRKKIAKNFAVKLNLLIDMEKMIKSSYQPMIKSSYQPMIKSSYQPMIDMGKKLINKEIPHPRTIKLDINKDMIQQYNHNNTNNLLMQEDMQYFYIAPIKGEIYGKKTVFYNRNNSA